MKPNIELRAGLTEPLAEALRKRLSVLPFKINYQEEQRGASLVICIKCTLSQEHAVREILKDLDITPGNGKYL